MYIVRAQPPLAQVATARDPGKTAMIVVAGALALWFAFWYTKPKKRRNPTKRRRKTLTSAEKKKRHQRRMESWRKAPRASPRRELWQEARDQGLDVGPEWSPAARTYKYRITYRDGSHHKTLMTEDELERWLFKGKLAQLKEWDRRHEAYGVGVYAKKKKR